MDTTNETAVCLTVSSNTSNDLLLLQQTVVDFHRELLTEIKALVNECLAECLVAPQLRVRPGSRPAPRVKPLPQLSFRARLTTALETGPPGSSSRRRVHPRTPSAQLLSKPVRAPAWEGEDGLVMK